MVISESQTLVIASIINECIENGVSISLVNKKKVRLAGEDSFCGGYFDSDDKVLAVATKMSFKRWFLILLHEYNHFKQWIENPSLFTPDDFWGWLEGDVELNKGEVIKITNNNLNLELDCEKRTAQFIKDNPQLKINVSDYIKRANAYIYLYPMIAKYRKWVGSNKKAPYRVKEIYDIMPDHFVENYWDVPEEYERLCISQCFA